MHATAARFLLSSHTDECRAHKARCRPGWKHLRLQKQTLLLPSAALLLSQAVLLPLLLSQAVLLPLLLRTSSSAGTDAFGPQAAKGPVSQASPLS